MGNLSHSGLGQMQLYAHYYDRERCTAGNGPTVGLTLCTDKNDVVARYTPGEDTRQIFASRYQLYLPGKEDLAARSGGNCARCGEANGRAAMQGHCRTRGTRRGPPWRPWRASSVKVRVWVVCGRR